MMTPSGPPSQALLSIAAIDFIEPTVSTSARKSTLATEALLQAAKETMDTCSMKSSSVIELLYTLLYLYSSKFYTT